MARKLWLEFEGAKYHVISRGNYRKDIFEGRSAEAFEKTLFEACEKCGWKLHAYVIMSNHYHLAVETPEGNLVDGMRWLQGVFGNRFNAFRGERGHVFQSRYKSLVVEEGERKNRDEMQKRYCRGWAVAGAEYRKDLKKMYGEMEGAGEAVGEEFGELKEARWERVLVGELKRERKSLQDAAAEPKAMPWKVRIAGVLRQRTTATNGWIADRLCMGHPSRVRNLIRDLL
jgi:REP element-mobilizing transposase RayT